MMPVQPPSPTSPEIDLLLETESSAARSTVPFGLLRYFTGASLAIILAASLGSGIVSAWVVHRAFVHMERDEADSLAEDLVTLFGYYGHGREQWGAQTPSAALRTEVEREMRNFGILDFTVYSLEGKRLDEFALNPSVRSEIWAEGFEPAKANRSEVRWEAGSWWPFALFGSPRAGILESYVPIRSRDSVVAVARLRRDLGPDLAEARRVLPGLMALSLLYGIGVFASLWLLVRKADRILRSQYRELEEAQIAIEYRNHLLEELQRRKDEFYTMCSHDLRSPLVSVQAGCKVLLAGHGGALNSEQKEIVNDDLRNTTVVLDLVDNLLDLARIEDSDDELDATSLDLREVLESVVAANRPYAASQETLLKLDAPDDDFPIRGDRLKLLRVFNNLLSNAIKHSPKAAVTVTLRRSAEGLRISVTDQGPGISQEARAGLFRGRRSKRTAPEAREEGSHGIGLSIVRRFVDLHGGSVEVMSEEGHGSTFVVTLPPPDDRAPSGAGPRPGALLSQPG